MTRPSVRLAIATAALVAAQATAWFGHPAAVSAATSPFTDIVGTTFEADVDWLYAEGTTVGCSATLYCPTEEVTREQMASFLVRMFDLTEGGDVDAFTDDETSSHEVDINRLAYADMTEGCAADLFCPRDPVSRGEMASFIARIVPLTDGAGDNYFRDDNGSTHEADIDRAAAAGITTGCVTWQYCPTASVTRGQMAAFLHRIVEPIAVPPHPAPGPLLYITVDGNDANNICVDEADPCRTIKHGISQAFDGDILHIGPGTYTDQDMKIAADITLRGAANGGTVIGTAVGNVREIFEIERGAVVEIDRLVVRGYRGYLSPIENYGSLRIVNTTMTDNEVGTWGGAITNSGVLKLEDSILSDNHADMRGGAIENRWSGTMEIENSLLTGNDAASVDHGGHGGAINTWSYLSVTNSTIAFNEAGSGGGGIQTRNGYDPEVWLLNSTITGNVAVYWNGGVGGEDVHLQNTIIAGNSATYVPDGTAFVSNDSSIVGVPAGLTLADILDPAGLADNGGPTMTIALVDGADNPAIDAGNDTVCAAAPVGGIDQRGLPRTAPCDIGAFELQP